MFRLIAQNHTSRRFHRAESCCCCYDNHHHSGHHGGNHRSCWEATLPVDKNNNIYFGHSTAMKYTSPLRQPASICFWSPLFFTMFVTISTDIEVLIKLLECGLTAFSIHTNVIKYYDPKNGRHFERRAGIGRRNTPLNSYVAVSRAQ